MSRLFANVRTMDECALLFYLGARSRDVNHETNDDHRHIVNVLRFRDSEKRGQPRWNTASTPRQAC